MNDYKAISKASLLGLASLPLALSTGTRSEDIETKKMNVLFIAVDDMNNDLGCYGNTIVKSPNIDRLSSQGVTFANAYCQFPLSSPSRSSLLTGMRPDKIKVFNLTYHFRQDMPEVVTLPQMFSQNGYYTARVGKLYHYGNPGDIGTNGLDDRSSWMERINPAGIDKTSLEDDVINYTPQRGLGSAMVHYSDPSGSDHQHTDGIVASETIKLLAKHRDEPFFIAAGFYRPHCPYIAPSAYFDMYDINKITIPEMPPEIKDKYPPQALASTANWPVFGLPSDQIIKSKLAYYASISFVDAQIGKLLRGLDSLGLSDNTIIVFWSDHGYHLGEHGLWFKQSCFEESAKAPMIINVPGLKKTKGEICRRTVELVDIYPTLAELTGLDTPEGIEGESLYPLLRNPKAKWDHPAYTQVQRGKIPGHSVRTEKWRYTEWNFGKEGSELYDELADPKELNNLAGKPGYEKVVQEMKALLKKVHPVPVTGGVAVEDTRARYCN